MNPLRWKREYQVSCVAFCVVDGMAGLFFAWVDSLGHKLVITNAGASVVLRLAHTSIPILAMAASRSRVCRTDVLRRDVGCGSVKIALTAGVCARLPAGGYFRRAGRASGPASWGWVSPEAGTGARPRWQVAARSRIIARRASPWPSVHVLVI
jgi:hypothetical protein